MTMLDHAEIRFTVYGAAAPAGSKRAFVQAGHARIVDANPQSRSWKNDVAAAAHNEYAGPLLTGALELTLIFYRPRPQAHHGTNGVKASAPRYPTTRPDALKLARAIEDALTGILWRDDAQIVEEHLYKRFGEPARVEILVRELGGKHAPHQATNQAA